MTKTTTTDTEAATDTAAEAPAPPADDTPHETPAAKPEGPEGASNGKAGAEAARYRTQLRAAEAQVADLSAKVEALQRAQVEALAADLAKPAALWASGTELADLLDDDGNVDPAKVSEAVDRARDELGLQRAPRTPLPDPTQGHGTGAQAANGWVAAMSPR